MSNKLYRPRRKRRKEKLSLIDKIEIGGITIAAVVLIGWSSWSIVDSFTPDPVIPSREVYTDGISNYIAGLTSASDSTDAKTDTDSSDANIKDADSDKKEEKDDETDSEKEKKKTETTAAADTQKAADEAAKSQAEAAATPSQAAEGADTTAAAPAETTTAPTSYIAKEALNIRRTPDEKAQAVANYQAGETLNVTEDDSTHAGWLKVNKNGVEGYVSKDFVNVN